MQVKYYYYSSSIGEYCLVEREGALVRLWLGDRIGLAADDEVKETPLMREVHRQLEAYFGGKLRHFDLPLAPRGTAFQMKVWELLKTIPFGETVTYGEVARRLGDGKACRAVGMANSRNPLPIFIPCHRVIGADGQLTGYSGGLELKMKLLKLEGICLYGI